MFAQEYLQRLEPLGVRPVEAEPRLFTNPEADKRFEKLLAKHRVGSGELLVGVHAGARHGRDRWPVERFASMAARMIHNFDAYALVFAGPDEKGLAKKIAKQVGSKRVIVFESVKLERSCFRICSNESVHCKSFGSCACCRGGGGSCRDCFRRPDTFHPRHPESESHSHPRNLVECGQRGGCF